MSTEWYLQAHESGDDQTIPVTSILAELESERIDIQGGSIVVYFEDGQFSTFSLDSKANTVSSFGVESPVRSRRLNDLLFRILNLGNFILYAPDGTYPIAANKDIAAHLPEGMIEGLGQPRVATSSDEFHELISGMYE